MICKTENPKKHISVSPESDIDEPYKYPINEDNVSSKPSAPSSAFSSPSSALSSPAVSPRLSPRLSPSHSPSKSLFDPKRPSDIYPPAYLETAEGWEIVRAKDIERLEQEQLIHIKSLIDEILHLENSHQQDGKLQILSDMNVLMKYKNIEITVRKVHPTTTMEYIKGVSEKVVNVVTNHPLKMLGLFTLWSIV